MDYSAARDFVGSWLQAWNARDVDAVLAHFARDATFTSPVAARMVEGHGTYLGDDADPGAWARPVLDRADRVSGGRAAGQREAPRQRMNVTAIGSPTEGDASLSLLEEAVAVGTPSQARLELAYAYADLGAAFVSRRRRRDGREMLRLGIDQALTCGATALAQRLRGELGAGGGRPPPLELTGLAALTPAERRVCDLVVRDMSNREVAQTLFVTEKTVELHLTSAYRKLGIRSRFQLSTIIPAAVTAE